MKYFVFLLVMIQGDPEPFIQSKEVPTLQECKTEAAKLLDHPLPRNAKEFQAGCAIVQDGQPT